MAIFAGSMSTAACFCHKFQSLASKHVYNVSKHCYTCSLSKYSLNSSLQLLMSMHQTMHDDKLLRLQLSQGSDSVKEICHSSARHASQTSKKCIQRLSGICASRDYLGFAHLYMWGLCDTCSDTCSDTCMTLHTWIVSGRTADLSCCVYMGSM